MKLINKTLVNLSRGLKDSALGHISIYEKKNGNIYYVYYVEARYFGCKEVDHRPSSGQANSASKLPLSVGSEWVVRRFKCPPFPAKEGAFALS